MVLPKVGTLAVWAALLTCCLGLLGSCDRQKTPLRIGFIGSLSGRFSDLATEGLNGLRMAVRECNEAGGINGQMVEVLDRDCRYDSALAEELFAELVDKKVAAVVGPMTSSMAAPIAAKASSLQMPVVSPTASTNSLAGLDDWFVRVINYSECETERLARYAAHDLDIDEMIILADISNAEYAREYARNFISFFAPDQERRVHLLEFNGNAEPDFRVLAGQIASQPGQAVLLATSALDGALLCQHLRMQGWTGHVFSSGWGMTADFIAQAGMAGEGVVFAHAFNPDGFALPGFADTYRRMFGHDPGFAAMFGYEAGLVLLKALRTSRSPSETLQNMLGSGPYRGVQGEFFINAFGDVERTIFLIHVKDGALRALVD